MEQANLIEKSKLPISEKCCMQKLTFQIEIMTQCHLNFKFACKNCSNLADCSIISVSFNFSLLYQIKLTYIKFRTAVFDRYCRINFLLLQIESTIKFVILFRVQIFVVKVKRVYLRSMFIFMIIIIWNLHFIKN